MLSGIGLLWPRAATQACARDSKSAAARCQGRSAESQANGAPRGALEPVESRIAFRGFDCTSAVRKKAWKQSATHRG